MRITYKLLAASGLLILSALLIIRQSGRPRNDSVGTEPAKSSSSHAVTNLAETSRDMSPKADQTTAANASRAAGVTPRSETAPASPSPAISSSAPGGTPPPHAALAPQSPAMNFPAVNLPAPGFQLADDVQLPAVILALSAAEKNPEKKVPEPIAAAMRGIIDTFYQDLAESARGATAGGNQGAALETGTDGTVIIQKGPAVERARARANQTYRALFGDDAFNRMTRDALLESQLPVNAGTGGN